MPRVFEDLLIEELCAKMKWAVEYLPWEDQVILEYRYLQPKSRSWKEISKILHRSYSWLEKRMENIFMRLQEIEAPVRLEDIEEPYEDTDIISELMRENILKWIKLRFEGKKIAYYSKVIIHRFFDDLTLEETAKKLGKKRKEEIRRIEAKALRMLRHPTSLRALAAFTGHPRARKWVKNWELQWDIERERQEEERQILEAKMKAYEERELCRRILEQKRQEREMNRIRKEDEKRMQANQERLRPFCQEMDNLETLQEQRRQRMRYVEANPQISALYKKTAQRLEALKIFIEEVLKPELRRDLRVYI